jgi:hypothetical protein
METQYKSSTWSLTEIFIFRLVLIFFIILFIPYDLNLYHSLNGGGVSFQNLFQIATYRTSFISESLYVGNHLEGYYNWLIALLLALVGAIVWGFLKKEQPIKEYNQLYYWLRVALRYRLALAIIFTGVVKLFPIQIPEPTLSDFHTPYGNFLLWKMYYLTNAVSSALYIPSLGILEIIGGLFLLNRKTVTIGAGLLIALLTNIVIVNYVYEIGEQVYSSFLLLIALVIILPDVPGLYNLLFLEKTTQYKEFSPIFSKLVYKLRSVFQVVFLLTITGFTVLTFVSWKDTNYPFPKTKGIADIKGVYNVKEFNYKGKILPYSITDSLRWQNVVFEEWNTISIRNNIPVKIDSLKPRIVFQEDAKRNYEQLGNSGRHFFSYEHNEKKGKYSLKLVDKSDTKLKYTFSLEKRNKNELLLKGIDVKGDSLNITLQRLPKKYLLQEGRRKPIKIY